MPGEYLIKEFISGDPDAFKKIYHLLFQDVYSLCFRYTRNYEAAEELTHDAFVILWQKCRLIDPEQGVKPYLLSIARHEVFRWIKKNATTASLKAELQMQFMRQRADIAQDIASDASLDLKQVKKILNEFPAKRRTVFELIKFDELSYSEVADKLSITRDAVKDHMIKANRVLKKMNNNGEFTYEFIFLISLLLS